MHAKVGDLVRTTSGREGRVRAIRKRTDGGWVADVEVRFSVDSTASVLPYDAADITVLRLTADADDAILLDARSVRNR